MPLTLTSTKTRLARRLTIYVVLASTFVAIFTSAFQLYVDYRRDLNVERLDELEKTHLKSIASRVWVLDFKELENTLSDLLGLPSFRYIEVSDEKATLLTLGKQELQNVISREYPLIYTFKNIPQVIGALYVEVSLDEVYQRIYDRAFDIILSNGVKTFIVSGLILLIFYNLIARHLTTLVDFTDDIDIESLDQKLKLNRRQHSPSQQDEFDKLVDAFSTMQARLHEAIKEIKTSEEKFRGVLEGSLDGVLMVNAKGTIELVNPAILNMTGYTETEIIGRSVDILVAGDKFQHSKLREKYLESPEPRSMEGGFDLSLKRKDGSNLPVEISLTPLQTDKGLIVGAMVTDISQRKKAEREKEDLIATLEEKNAELERFTYTASHDLKSPLVTLAGFVGLLKKDIEENDPVRIEADLQRIAEASQTMQSLLDDLLELSRIGNEKKFIREVSLNDLIEDVVQLLDQKIKTSGALIEVQENLPIVRVVEARFKEIFLNLIENALKFSIENRQPFIEIGTKSIGNETVYFVRDNGIGIEPAYHNQIFGLFNRIDQNREGTGIGLAIVKRIIETHGGRIWVESAGKDQGSMFCFVISPLDGEKDA